MSSTPSLRIINPQSHSSFVIKEEPFDLETRRHYHQELEIMYFQKGKVSAIMGNRFTEFDEGEMVFLGSNFPHVIFKHGEQKEKSDVQPEGIVIQFRYDFLGNDFFSSPEMSKVNSLISKSKFGIHFSKETTKVIKPSIEGISRRNNVRQLFDLLEILTKLSEEKDIKFLTIENQYNRSELDEHRMHLIKRYIYENFRNKIKVSDVADLVSMTETSFCRYFKRRTLKSLTRTLNEIRISYACEILRNKDVSVCDACYQCGFTSPAFFSRTFKKIVGLSPSAYKANKVMKVVRW